MLKYLLLIFATNIVYAHPFPNLTTQLPTHTTQAHIQWIVPYFSSDLEITSTTIECGTVPNVAQYSKTVSGTQNVVLLKDIIPPNITFNCWAVTRFKEVTQFSGQGLMVSNTVQANHNDSTTITNPMSPLNIRNQ